MLDPNIQFSVASHVMVARAHFSGTDLNSATLAASVNFDPSLIWRIVARLAKAGLLVTAQGETGACSLARRPLDITLDEIYRACEAPLTFAIHTYPEHATCPVSVGIEVCLEGVLERAQREYERGLAEQSLADVAEWMPA